MTQYQSWVVWSSLIGYSVPIATSTMSCSILASCSQLYPQAFFHFLTCFLLQWLLCLLHLHYVVLHSFIFCGQRLLLVFQSNFGNTKLNVNKFGLLHQSMKPKQDFISNQEVLSWDSILTKTSKQVNNTLYSLFFIFQDAPNQVEFFAEHWK